jgi:hypothetical protein
MATGIQRPRPIRVDSGHRTYCFGSVVAGRFSDELHPGGEAEFGVDVDEVGLHGARGDEKPCGDVLVAEPLANQSHHVALGRSERGPAVGGAFVFAVPALGVCDGFLSGQGRALGPGGFKILLAQGITHRRHRGFVFGLVDREADLAGALADAVRCAEEPGRFEVTTRIAG